jgi:hypothetical protein
MKKPTKPAKSKSKPPQASPGVVTLKFALDALERRVETLTERVTALEALEAPKVAPKVEPMTPPVPPSIYGAEGPSFPVSPGAATAHWWNRTSTPTPPPTKESEP